MSQHDFDIANATASPARADINLALKALGSLSSGPTAPATTYANMMWYDTTANILKMRSEANDAWINIGTLDQSLNTFTPAGVATQTTAVWEAGTDTNESLVSAAKVAAAIAAQTTDSGAIVASSGLNSTSGYVKFGNGIIFQWVYSTSTSGTKTLTYPLTFPTRVWHVSMSLVANTQNYQSAAHRSNWNTSLSSITVYNDGEAVEIFAVGY